MGNAQLIITKIIITAPHTVCDNNSPYRMCDRLAEKAARLLYNELGKDKAELIINDSGITRNNLDFNRKESSEQHFHKKLNKILLESQNGTVLLDIHSYPLETIEWNKEPAVLLCFKESNGVVDKLKSIIKKNDNASNENFIIKKAQTAGIPATIIEFRENLTELELKKLIVQISNRLQ